jgi:hypothetical protein
MPPPPRFRAASTGKSPGIFKGETNRNFAVRKVTYINQVAKTGHLLAKLTGLMVLLGLLAAPNRSICGDAPSLTEYQVKALFLLNFTKYVEWPAETFESADSAFKIGVVGEDRFGEDLKKAMTGKMVNGRAITVQQLGKEVDGSKFQILFISASEKNRLREILDKVKTTPVLTVGETEQFTQSGGVINFTKKDGKVRLEINLDAAHGAKLQLSSKLLGVADVVRGKQ